MPRLAKSNALDPIIPIANRQHYWRLPLNTDMFVTLIFVQTMAEMAENRFLAEIGQSESEFSSFVVPYHFPV